MDKQRRLKQDYIDRQTEATITGKMNRQTDRWTETTKTRQNRQTDGNDLNRKEVHTDRQVGKQRRLKYI